MGSKAALEASCRYLAFELGHQGIRVHAVSRDPCASNVLLSCFPYIEASSQAAQCRQHQFSNSWSDSGRLDTP